MKKNKKNTNYKKFLWDEKKNEKNRENIICKNGQWSHLDFGNLISIVFPVGQSQWKLPI
jgi:hypothetical protein